MAMRGGHVIFLVHQTKSHGLKYRPARLHTTTLYFFTENKVQISDNLLNLAEQIRFQNIKYIV